MNEIGPLFREMRQAGLNGNAEGLSTAYSRAYSLADKISTNEEEFSRQWLSLLKFELDVAPISRALRTMRRAIGNGYSTNKNQAVVTPMMDYLTKHRELFLETEEYVRSIATGTPGRLYGNFQINFWSRLLYPQITSLSAREIWMTITDAAINEARLRGFEIAMIPDFLAPLVITGSSRTLSFHTEGRATGLTHYKPADLPGYAVIDPGGYSGWSSLAKAKLQDLPLPSPEEASEFYELHYREVVEQNISKYPQKIASCGSGLPDQYVFVPLQVAGDRTQQLARIPMLKMLRMVVDRFFGTGTRVIVKRHPNCKNPKVTETLDRLSAKAEIELRDDSIHTLLAGARAVFTVNSGVGSEAMAHLKPIYLFGDADYNCAAHRIAGDADFVRLTETLSPALSDTEMKQFLCYYRTRYLVRIADTDRIEQLVAERIFGDTASCH